MNVSDQVTEVGVKYLAEMATEIVPAGYKQTEVGVIPEDWDLTTIDNVAIFTGGAQPPRSTFLSRPKLGYVRLIQIRDYKTSDYETYIPESFARKKCSSTDIMIGRYGPPIFQILRGIDGAYNVALIKAIPKAVINQEFLYYFLKTEKLFELMELLSQRSSGQTGVELPALKAYLIPLPHKYEQTAIANALYDVDALINELEKLITKKQAIKTATMQQLLTGRTRLPQFALREDGTKKGYKQTELGMIPDDWVTPTVKELSKNIIDYRGRTPKKLGMEWGGNISALSAGNVKKGFIDFDLECYFGSQELYSRWMTSGDPKQGDIVFTMEAPLGNAALIPDDRKYILSQRVVLLQINEEKFESKLIIQILLSRAFQLYLYDCATGSTAQGIKRTTFESLHIPLPNDIYEQTAIATILSDMDTEIQTLQQRLSKTRQIKQGMMQELLTGKTRLIQRKLGR